MNNTTLTLRKKNNQMNTEKKVWKFTVPPTMEQGSYWGICNEHMYETKHQNALSQYNSARAHDGLEPISRMPNGTTYNLINPQPQT